MLILSCSTKLGKSFLSVKISKAKQGLASNKYTSHSRLSSHSNQTTESLR